MDALLDGLQAVPKGEKCVIFSQFTAFLDLLKVPLEVVAHMLRLAGCSSGWLVLV